MLTVYKIKENGDTELKILDIDISEREKLQKIINDNKKYFDAAIRVCFVEF